MPEGVALGGLLWAVCFILLWRHTRFTMRRPPVRTTVLRPIVIPARYGSHTFTDAEIIDRFLAVDWLLSHRDNAAQPVRDW